MAKISNHTTRDFGIVKSEKPEYVDVNFNKVKVGPKTLKNDVTADLNFYKKVNSNADQETVLRAINNNDIKTQIQLSNFFYNSNGIYARLCRYMAYLFRYDWYVTPIVYDENIKSDKIIEGFYKSIVYLDNCNLKGTFNKIALKIIKNGSYYGYKVQQKDKTILQDLPIEYCRSRFSVNNIPVVEMNMKYFDDTFTDSAQRQRVIAMFPKDIQKGYVLYKKGSLPAEFMGDDTGWYVLDYNFTVKFNLNDTDAPMFVSIIPALIDLDEAQALDKKKMQQKLLKIIIQQMPLDKNGDLIFDPDEAQALHNNVVQMLGKAIGVDVLTTFADVDVADLSDKSNITSMDELKKVERSVYNEAGVSQMQFNTDGNIALEKSIANDEASMSDLIVQFENYANDILFPFNKNKKRLEYKLSILPTTIYNYKDLSKIYKEQMQLGFSKLLPQVALGQSQNSILATAYFENKILDLNSVFIPPQMSSTMSSKDASSAGNTTDSQGGRPELPDDQKTTKTIQNRESIS